MADNLHLHNQIPENTANFISNCHINASFHFYFLAQFPEETYSYSSTVFPFGPKQNCRSKP